MISHAILLQTLNTRKSSLENNNKNMSNNPIPSYARLNRLDTVLVKTGYAPRLEPRTVEVSKAKSDEVFKFSEDLIALAQHIGGKGVEIVNLGKGDILEYAEKIWGEAKDVSTTESAPSAPSETAVVDAEAVIEETTTDEVVPEKIRGKVDNTPKPNYIFPAFSAACGAVQCLEEWHATTTYPGKNEVMDAAKKLAALSKKAVEHESAR